METDNPDLRDRAYIYWRLLSTDPEVGFVMMNFIFVNITWPFSFTCTSANLYSFSLEVGALGVDVVTDCF